MGGSWSIKAVLPAIAPDLDYALRRYCALDTQAMVRVVRGYRSRHNQRYWAGKEYLGIGAGAHSFLKRGWGIRQSNITDPLLYMERAEKTGFEESLNKEEAIEDTIFLGLRRKEGIDIKRFEERFGLSLNSHLSPLQGLVKEEAGRLRLTPQGLLLSNEVCVRLML